MLMDPDDLQKLLARAYTETDDDDHDGRHRQDEDEEEVGAKYILRRYLEEFSAFRPGEKIREKEGWRTWPENFGFNFVAIEDTTRFMLSEGRYLTAGRFTKTGVGWEAQIKYDPLANNDRRINRTDPNQISYAFTLVSPVLNGAFTFLGGKGKAALRIEGSMLLVEDGKGSYCPLAPLKLNQRYSVDIFFSNRFMDYKIHLASSSEDCPIWETPETSQFIERKSRDGLTIDWHIFSLIASPDATGELILHLIHSPYKKIKEIKDEYSEPQDPLSSE